MPVRIPILAILTLALLPTAHAADLWQVWQLARSNDPAFRQAEATRRVSMQDRPAAWARLFPSISLNASRTWNNTSSSALRFFGGSQVVPVNSTSNDRQDQWGAQLTQPLFNWQLFQALRGADLSVAQAEARYHATIQGLIVTTAQAYFNVLNAQDNLNADRADARALAKQYEQVTQQYKVGLASITGVRQAEAGYDQARARVIGSRQALARAEEALRAITGRYVKRLAAPRAALPLIPPHPARVEAWVTRGLSENPTLVASRLGVRIASNLVAQQQAGYLPQLSLVLSHTRQSLSGKSAYSFGGGTGFASPNRSQMSNNQIALQLSWNIFSGGATRAATRQAEFQADVAQARDIAARRSVEQQVRNAYLAVLSGIAQVQATRQSVAASRVSLQATVAGRQVGTQTMLNVLTARKDLLSAEKSFYSARYAYLIAVLKLEQATGSLTPASLKRLNGWLVRAPAAASAPPPAAATPQR